MISRGPSLPGLPLAQPGSSGAILSGPEAYDRRVIVAPSIGQDPVRVELAPGLWVVRICSDSAVIHLGRIEDAAPRTDPSTGIISEPTVLLAYTATAPAPMAVWLDVDYRGAAMYVTSGVEGSVTLLCALVAGRASPAAAGPDMES